jgi:hypothetical protein
LLSLSLARSLARRFVHTYEHASYAAAHAFFSTTTMAPTIHYTHRKGLAGGGKEEERVGGLGDGEEGKGD